MFEQNTLYRCKRCNQVSPAGGDRPSANVLQFTVNGEPRVYCLPCIAEDLFKPFEMKSTGIAHDPYHGDDQVIVSC